uniref:Uncharacterized protein n=1 Tax=Aegilops tauschii subsp. strangulata TaxID=200361 RepID=A0A453C181_AEGTS
CNGTSIQVDDDPGTTKHIWCKLAIPILHATTATGSSEAADVAETSKPSKKFAFVDVSPEELQKQKELQSSLQTVGVKSDSTESETKGDTEQVSFLQKLGNRLPVQFVVINTCRMVLKDSYKWCCF